MLVYYRLTILPQFTPQLKEKKVSIEIDPVEHYSVNRPASSCTAQLLHVKDLQISICQIHVTCCSVVFC